MSVSMLATIISMVKGERCHVPVFTGAELSIFLNALALMKAEFQQEAQK